MLMFLLRLPKLDWPVQVSWLEQESTEIETNGGNIAENQVICKRGKRRDEPEKSNISSKIQACF
ncbi:hypothetical protein DCC62_20875 [candidate division KSB1 bacterium]|nr:MAG: hypothetical protein DCC62_20875 [candidate division KSB1 bacterium]